MTPRRRFLELAAFTAGASATVAFLVREAFLKGYVLGQAELMFQFLPWLGHRPVGWRVANPLLFDVPAVFYPFLAHAREAVHGGHIPLWSAAVGAGEPFLASFQSAVFSLADAFTVTADTTSLRMIRDGAVDLRRVVLLERAPDREDWPDRAAAPDPSGRRSCNCRYRSRTTAVGRARISKEIIGAAIAVHRRVGPGCLESAYSPCLAVELQRRGLDFRTKVPLSLRYDELVVSRAYEADFVVEDLVVVEIKALAATGERERRQLQTYLELEGCPLGLILNFGALRLVDGIKRVVNNFRALCSFARSA